MGEKQKVLMVVKTYPTPSTAHGETVCTAGINIDTGLWVRIFPYPFRTAQQYHKFQKYETFEFDLEKSDLRDKRPESHKLLDIDSARKIAGVISTADAWAERMKYLEPTILPSVQGMTDGLYDETTDTFGRSLALIQVQPNSAQVTFEKDRREWDAKDSIKLERANGNAQRNLFATNEQIVAFQQLEKLPFKVRLRFRDMAGGEHALLVQDWEIGVLFLKMRDEHGEEIALEKVKYKIENQIFGENKDTYLILGSVFAHLKKSALVVVGFVWPNKRPAPPAHGMESLFAS